MITEDDLAEWERAAHADGPWAEQIAAGAVPALIAEVRRLRALHAQESCHTMVATDVVRSNLSAEAESKLRAEIAATGSFSLTEGQSAVVRFSPATPRTHIDAPPDSPPGSRP